MDVVFSVVCRLSRQQDEAVSGSLREAHAQLSEEHAALGARHAAEQVGRGSACIT